MAVPWIFYFIESRKLKQAIFAFGFLILSKENMAFWAFFLTCSMLLMYWKDKKIRKLLIFMSVFSLIYFFSVVNLIIPALANAGRKYNHLNYLALGTGFGDIIKNVIHAPHIVIDLLYKTASEDPLVQHIKPELHKFVLLSGGFALIFKPQYLLMLLPIYAQKLFHDDPVKWGVGLHYSIEFAPILTIAVYEFVYSYFKRKNLRVVIMTFVMISGLISTLSIMKKNNSLWYNFTAVQFFKKEHYKTDFNKKLVYDALKTIPSDARISANQTLIPHLCLRDFIYTFPVVRDAEYISILKDGSYYPIRPELMEVKLQELYSNPEWEVFYDKEALVIFKRKQRR